MPHLALCFARSLPVMNSVLIGPRTPEQLDDLLPSTDVIHDSVVLDRIDEIIGPGIDLKPEENFDAVVPAIAERGAPPTLRNQVEQAARPRVCRRS